MGGMILRKSLKILAVISALGIGSAVVWHRYEQGSRRTKAVPESKVETPPPVIFTSSKNMDVVFRFDRTVDPQMLPSTKLGHLLKPEDVRVTRDSIDELLKKRETPGVLPNPADSPE